MRIPDGAIEIARMTTIKGRPLIAVYQLGDGTFGYRADGAGGSGLSLSTVLDRMRDCREWPGGKTARVWASAFFQTPINV